MHAKQSCHICKELAVVSSQEFETLGRVASDCRPWPAGGSLGVCTHCGMVQKITDQKWRDEASKIYADYHLFHQSADGSEQPVFNQSSGVATPRSQQVLEFAIQAGKLAATGKMMDVGCGNGAMLRAYSALLPNWELNGYEPNLTQGDKVLSIPGIKTVYGGELSNVPSTFDLISVIHVLEHVEDPIPFLKAVLEKLNENGILLIEVPYFMDNPFDLLIADHCTHFTVPTLLKLLEVAGYEILSMRTDVVEKEISVLAKASKMSHVSNASLNFLKATQETILESQNALQQSLTWISSVVKDAKAKANKGNFGIFGTSISANWLLGELDSSVNFFIEEDKSRVGQMYRDRPVYDPAHTPEGSDVYLVLPRQLAEKIVNRLKIQHAQFHIPPALV